MMKRRHMLQALAIALPAAMTRARVALAQAPAGDPLPSWAEGPAKRAILAFVRAVTAAGSAEFVPPEQRIATFDNDGTLWVEQPAYTQLLFALDRVRELAPAHPDWRQRQPFKAVLDNDMKALMAGGERGLLELVMATHAGMTPEHFEAIVRQWLATARHPTLQRPFDQLVYQPMLEVLAFLRAAGFQTFIVSGGGVEFMRVFSQRVYGVAPAQVVGSTIRTQYEVRDGRPAIVRLPEVEFIDDKAGKPVGINRAIGQRPIAAFGNSDGDFEMLQWTTTGSGRRLGLLVHHDDAQREFAYDRTSAVGRLSRALDEAPKYKWVVSSMKNDWKTVFPPAG